MNGGELVLTKKSIFSTLDVLRISKENTLFADVVAKEWGKLELKNMPDPNPTLLENLLIQVIEDLYDEEKATLANEKRECAIKHDISLLMFGLLDGHYHTIISQGVRKSVKSSIRYNEYLATNIYVKLEYADEGTYAEIAIKDKIERPGRQNRPLNHITKIAGDCKTQIADKLFDLIKAGAYQNCSQEAVVDEQTGQRTDLPKSRFTLENYVPRTSVGEMLYDRKDTDDKENAPKDHKRTGTNVRRLPDENQDDGNDPLTILRYILKIVGIFLGAILGLAFVTTIILFSSLAKNGGKFEIRTPEYQLSVDYSTEKQPTREVAESIYDPRSIPVVPDAPLDENSDSTEVSDDFLSSPAD